MQKNFQGALGGALWFFGCSHALSLQFSDLELAPIILCVQKHLGNNWGTTWQPSVQPSTGFFSQGYLVWQGGKMACEGPAAPVVSQSYLLQPTPVACAVLFLSRDVTTAWFRKRKVCVKEMCVRREMEKYSGSSEVIEY